MGGWKTWVGGGGMILAGIGQCAMAFAGQGDADITGGVALISGGLAVIGLGHKIEKAG